MANFTGDINELIELVAEKNKKYVDSNINSSLAAQAKVFQKEIEKDLSKLASLIQALEDIEYEDGDVDPEDIIAEIAVVRATAEANTQELVDLREALANEVKARINLMYSESLTEDDFNDTKYKTILELSSNLTLLERIVQDIDDAVSGDIHQVPADWNQEDETARDYIKNKPQIPKIIRSIYNFYEFLDNDIIRYDVFGDTNSWKVERFSTQTNSIKISTGSGEIPDTLADCQVLEYN